MLNRILFSTQHMINYATVRLTYINTTYEYEYLRLKLVGIKTKTRVLTNIVHM